MINDNNLAFMLGGGEMGKLTREYEWATTAVGVPEQWAQSLRTALGLVLHAKISMLLWWGPERIQFYNDAYRASLVAANQRPAALGQRAADYWVSEWATIEPLINQVLQEKTAVLGENQLLPICRNNQLEQAHWHHSYNPVWDETGSIAGILVVNQETPKPVLATQQDRERLQFALDAGQLGVWEADDDLCLEMRMDDRSLMLKGLTGTQKGPTGNNVSREQVLSTVHPDDKARVEAAYLNLFYVKSERYLDITYRTASPSGRPWRWVRSNAQAYFNAAGEPNFYGGIIQDVTKEIDAQHQIEASAAKLRLIFEKAPVGIFVVRGPDLIYELANERYLELTGRSAAVNLVGLALGSDLVGNSPGMQRAVQMVREALLTGKALAFNELKSEIAHNGEVAAYYFNVVCEPLYEADNRVSGVFTTIADVTNSVRIRQEVEANAAYLRRVFKHAAVGIVIFEGPRFIIETANPMLCDLWGCTEDQLLGKPLAVVKPPDADYGGQEALTRVWQTGQPSVEHEMPLTVNRGGQLVLVYADVVNEPLFDGSGKVTRIIQTATNVTERVLARQHVEELLEREQNLNELKSNFITLASHEFRTPLSTILSSAVLIGRYQGPGEADKRTRHVQRIKEAVTNLSQVLEDFISLSRMEQRALSSRPHPLHIKHFCEETVEDVQSILKPGQRLTYQHIAGQETVALHGQLLKHILLNLLGNASKYSANGQEIILVSSVRNQQLELIIKDKGIGIPEEDRIKLFSNFFRARNALHIQGTGLGLYVVKRYVDLLRGNITFTSQLDLGTTFVVQLPLAALPISI